MREVQLLCDEVLLMKRGKIVEEGSPQELLLKHGKDDLEQVFLDVSREEEA